MISNNNKQQQSICSSPKRVPLVGERVTADLATPIGNPTDKEIEKLWKLFGSVTVTNDLIDTGFHIWEKGTDRIEVIWKWFDLNHSKGVKYLLDKAPTERVSGSLETPIERKAGDVIETPHGKATLIKELTRQPDGLPRWEVEAGGARYGAVLCPTGYF